MSPDRSARTKRCLTCGEPFGVAAWNASRRFCSRVCSNPARGRRGRLNHGWKGGRRRHALGYVLVNLGPDRGEILEHRLVMQEHIGRELRSDEDVHHVNGVRTDNRIENLRLMSHQEHIRHHADERRGPKPESWTVDDCSQCGKPLPRRVWHESRFSAVFCDRDCWREMKGSRRAKLLAAISNDPSRPTPLQVLVAESSDVTRSAVMIALREMRAAGLVERVGTGQYLRTAQAVAL